MFGSDFNSNIIRETRASYFSQLFGIESISVDTWQNDINSLLFFIRHEAKPICQIQFILNTDAAQSDITMGVHSSL